MAVGGSQERDLQAEPVFPLSWLGPQVCRPGCVTTLGHGVLPGLVGMAVLAVP